MANRPYVPAFDARAMQGARATDAARIQQFRSYGNAATTHASNGLMAIGDFLASIFGAQDLQGLDPGTQSWLTYGLSRLAQSGMIPGMVDGGNMYDSVFHTLRTNHQGTGDINKDMDLAFMIAQGMDADLVHGNGTTNYAFTGGLEADVASQFYVQQFNSLMRQGMQVSGERVQLAQGGNIIARQDSMMRNVSRMRAEGTMSESTSRIYTGADKAMGAMGKETAMRYAAAAKMIADKQGISMADAYKYIQQNGADLLNTTGMADAYKSLTKEQQREAEELLKRDARAADYTEQVTQQTLIDYGQGKTKARLLGERVIGSDAVAAAMQGLVDDDLAVMQVGARGSSTVARGEGVGALDYIKSVEDYVRKGGMGITASGKARVQALRKAQEDAAEVLGADKLNDKEAMLDYIKKSLAQDGLTKEMRTSLEDLKQVVEGGTVDVETFTNNTKEMSGKVREMFSKYGSGLSVIKEAFGAHSFSELQQKARELGWGNLASDESLNRMNQGMADVLGISQASGRSVEQVLVERKDIAKALGALSGGAKYVSEAEISEQQLAKTYNDADELAGGRYTSQERFAMMKRSHENAKANFGAADAAAQLLNENPEAFSKEAADKLRSEIELMDSLLESDDPNARAQARTLNSRIQRQLQGTGFDEDEIRVAANQYGEERVSKSVRQGAVQSFARKLRDIKDAGTGQGLSKETRRQMTGIMNERLKLLGSSDTEWKGFLDAAQAGGDKFDEYLKAKGFSGDDLAAAKALQSQVVELQQSNSTAFNFMQRASTPQTLVGSVQRARKEQAEWDAIVKGSDYLTSIQSSGNFFTDMIRAATDGKQLTGRDLLSADMWQKIYNDVGGGTYGGGKTFESRAKAINDMFADNPEAWGEGATAVALTEDNNLSEESIESLIKNDKLLGLGEKERQAALDKFAKIKDPKRRSIEARKFMAEHGVGMELKDGVAVFAKAENIAEQTRRAERSLKLQQSLDFKDALKDDGNVSEGELRKMIEAHPELGTVDDKGVLTTDILGWSGKTLKQLTDTKNSYSVNYKNSDGKTNAQNMSDMSDSRNTGQALVDYVKDILGILKKFADDKDPKTPRDSAAAAQKAAAPQGNADGSSNSNGNS